LIDFIFLKKTIYLFIRKIHIMEEDGVEAGEHNILQRS